MTNQPHIHILGAGSLINPWLVKRLTEEGLSGHCYSRTQIKLPTATNFRWQALDVTRPEDFAPEPGSIIISLLPLWLLPPILPQMKDSLQLVAFSTTSVFGKSSSANKVEQLLVEKIATAEKTIIQNTEELEIPWTILRPTLIYDGKNDDNITAMAKFIKKWHILPIAGPGTGMRQPVHADDLAAAVISALQNKASYNRSFNLGGGETLSYHQMAVRIFEILEKKPLIVSLPTQPIVAGCKLLDLLLSKKVNSEMFVRMNQDLAYDQSDAQQCLHYAPRTFQPIFDKD